MKHVIWVVHVSKKINILTRKKFVVADQNGKIRGVPVGTNKFDIFTRIDRVLLLAVSGRCSMTV